jgi:hypothetical protein
MRGDARLRFPFLLLLSALVASACSSDGTGPHASSESSRPAAVAERTHTPSSGTVSGAFVRTCESKVSGGLGKGWRKDKSALVVGPIALLYPGDYADALKRLFARHGAGYSSQKVLVVVRRGAGVNVAIAPAASRVASLLYDPSGFKDTNSYQVSDGEPAVTFQACGGGGTRFTQFNGGFIVAGPRCVPIGIRTGSDAPMRRVLSFGKGHCAGPAAQMGSTRNASSSLRAGVGAVRSRHGGSAFRREAQGRALLGGE